MSVSDFHQACEFKNDRHYKSEDESEIEMLSTLKQIQKIMLPLAKKDDISSLKSFAVTMAIAFPVVFSAILPWLFSAIIPVWPFAVSIVFSLLYIAAPHLLYYPYVIWMVFASILGWLNTKVLLGIIFYLLITPIGLIMKAFGKLQYKHRVHADSNWITRDDEARQKQKKRLEEPF